MFRDLISTAGNGSDGQDKRERGAAARLAGAELPRRTSIEVPRTWVWGGLRNTRNPPRALAGHGGARSCARVDGGGSVGCGRRRARVQAAKVCYGYGNWRKGIKGSGWNLPKARGGQSCCARWTSASSGRRVVAELAERVLEDCAGPADPRNRSARVLRRCFGGQGSPVYAGGEDLK